MFNERQIDAKIAAVHDTEFGLQMSLAKMERDSTAIRQLRTNYSQELQRMAGVIDGYRAHGLVHLIGRNFQTIQAIADELANIRYHEVWSAPVQTGRRNRVRIPYYSCGQPFIIPSYIDKGEVNSFNKRNLKLLLAPEFAKIC